MRINKINIIPGLFFDVGEGCIVPDAAVAVIRVEDSLLVGVLFVQGLVIKVILLIFDFSEDVFDFLLCFFWIKLVRLDDVRQFALDVQLSVFFDDIWVELWNGNLVLTNKNNAVVGTYGRVCI